MGKHAIPALRHLGFQIMTSNSNNVIEANQRQTQEQCLVVRPQVNASRMAATDEDALLMAGPGAPGGAGQATQAAEQVARAKVGMAKLVHCRLSQHLWQMFNMS
jgi:hypothetical protein